MRIRDSDDASSVRGQNTPGQDEYDHAGLSTGEVEAVLTREGVINGEDELAAHK